MNHPDRDDASRYRGQKGRSYWIYQRSIGELGGLLDIGKFEPEVRGARRVLDFGCGGGYILANIKADERIGIEVNEDARNSARALGLDVRSALDQVPDGWADAVISNHALEHVLRPAETLSAIYKVLAPGGRLVLWLPLDDWRTARHPSTHDPNGHLFTWTPQALYNLLVETGFPNPQVEVVTHAWPPKPLLFSRNRFLFQTVGRLWGVLRKRRQIHAVALKPD